MAKLPSPVSRILRDDVDERLVMRVAHGLRAPKPPRMPWSQRIQWALVAVVLAVLVGLLWARREPEALTRTDGPAHAILEAPPGGAPLVARFSDASSVTVAPGGRLVPLALEPRAVVFMLERGAATFRVTPGGPRRWSVECGLVTVEVMGTRFSIARGDDDVTVRVTEGDVLVRGELVPDRVRHLKVGESITVRRPPPPPRPHVERPAPPPQAHLPGALPAHQPAPATASRPQAPVRPEAPEAPRPADDTPPIPRRIPPEPAPADAPREATAPPPRDAAAVRTRERLARADLARRSQDYELAVEALESILEEDPDDPQAGIAAFTLGALELDDLHRPERAVVAFEAAITRGVPAMLLEDAYARRVEALHLLARHGEAERAARDYFERYPKGRRAELVRRWSSVP